MSHLRSMTGKELGRALERTGFRAVRMHGSHARLHHPDGRAVTLPLSHSEVIGRGLLAKILRDARLSIDEIAALI